MPKFCTIFQATTRTTCLPPLRNVGVQSRSSAATGSCQRHVHFSKVLYLVPLYNKYSMALMFEIFLFFFVGSRVSAEHWCGGQVLGEDVSDDL